VHDSYLQAGAEVIETNTFGANRFRLERLAWTHQVREINMGRGAHGPEAAIDFHSEKQGASVLLPGPWARWECGWNRWAKSGWTKRAPRLRNRSPRWQRPARRC
jgi:S-methylmethionine-dependent homocysteine/selenocysteine methylase